MANTLNNSMHISKFFMWDGFSYFSFLFITNEDDSVFTSLGLAPLHLAVQAGHIDCIKALVEIGKANINIEDGCSGKTPLHYAVEKDQLAIVGYLINQVLVYVVI